MKIILIVIIVILAGIAGTGGYFVYNLSGQIDDLETQLGLELAQSFDQMSTILNDTESTLRQEIQEGALALSTTIVSTNQTLSEAIDLANGSFTEFKTQTIRNIGQIERDASYNLDRIGALEETSQEMADSVLPASELYENVKSAIVRISDGSRLLGSGFIISIDNEIAIVTAYHVIKGIREIYVTDYFGWTVQVGFSTVSDESDIAVLRVLYGQPIWLVDSPSVQALNLADSSFTKPGDPVFVIGSPGDGEESHLGLRDTITTGVISHVNRGTNIEGKYLAGLVQFDAAANFGNSGGPLLNADGDLIGLVIARIDPRLGDGISFAVTSNQISNVYELLKTAEKENENKPIWEPESLHIMFAHNPWTGLTVRDITPLENFSGNNAQTAGAKVTNVAGPASVAEIKVGDIITKMGARVINNSDEFYSFLVEYYAPGDTIVLEIMRGQEELSITLELQEK